MKLAADYRALARDALRGRWKTAVLAGLLASALGANIVNATGNITSNANRANQNSNITPGGSLELFSQANGGRLLAVLVVCIVVWTLFTLVVGGAVRLGYARFNLNLADGKAAAVSDLFSQKGRLWDGFCLKFLQGLYVALWSLLLVIPGIVKSYSYAMAPYIMAEHPALTANEAITESRRINGRQQMASVLSGFQLHRVGAALCPPDAGRVFVGRGSFLRCSGHGGRPGDAAGSSVERGLFCSAPL